MLEIRATSRFKKDVKKLKKQGKEISKLGRIIDTLAAEEELPLSNHDHNLSGNHSGHRECHIEPDWLLIYKTDELYLILLRSGSHSELFG